jgi:glycosyltransferase involved in cell wall biosynthesis
MESHIVITVSVIIPTFNRDKKVARAISSVLYQRFTDYEIIVVDDGSTDGSARLPAQFRRHIKYIRHHKNLGVSAARNTGINASGAPLIAFLDSDDYWLPEKLEIQVDFFRINQDAVACQTDEIWIRKGRRVNPKRKHLKPSGHIFTPSLKLCLVSPSAVMVRRSLLNEVGHFDEDLPACEDYDLWLRISCRYPVHLINKCLVVREGGASDQLSGRYKGMDRFRIRSLVKLIRSGRLDEEKLRIAFQELTEKCRVYGNGCLKREKSEEGAFYLKIPELLEKELAGSRPQSSPLSLCFPF